MSNAHVRYLLLGGGSAAASAAEAIRRHDTSGEILLVSAETSRPYHRPPLARGYLRRELKLEDLFTHPSDWYTKNHVTLETGRRALALDVAKKSVTLASGSEVYFDKLLIATGAVARHLDVPGAGLPGAIHLRTAEDVDRIHHASDVALAVSKGRVVVVGSGLIAAEVAASLALRKPHLGATSAPGSGPVLGPISRHPGGAPLPSVAAAAGGPNAARPLTVTLVCGRKHLFDPLVGEHAAKAILRGLEALGVTVITDAPVTALEGDGRVQRVVTAQGIYPCDLTIVAEGWTASKDLLRGTSIAAEKAILVDPRGQTNIPGIYAAGECAAMFDPVFGKHRVLDHWDVTVSRGLVVGANMAGANEPWSGVTVHRAEIGPARIVVIGEPRFTDRRIIRDAGDQGLAEIAIDKDNRVCAAALVNWRPPEGVMEALVRARTDITAREEDLRDPTGRM